MSPTYYNLLPPRLQQELEAARRVDLTPIEIPSAAFEALAAEGERMIYVVIGGQLLVSKRQVGVEHITHAVLANGGPVQAAGEFEVVAEQRQLVVSALNNMSGHYCPPDASLQVAQEAFENAGIRVRSGAVQSYDFGTL